MLVKGGRSMCIQSTNEVSEVEVVPWTPAMYPDAYSPPKEAASKRRKAWQGGIWERGGRRDYTARFRDRHFHGTFVSTMTPLKVVAVIAAKVSDSCPLN
jgi:hypothetical protein